MVSITTKLVPNCSTFKQALQKIEPGTKLVLAEPMGGFVLPDDPVTPLLFVAGGIGITPYRSMIKYLTDTNQKRTIQLIYAANQSEELAFTQLFFDYDLEFIPVIKEPDRGWYGETGTLDAESVIKLAGGMSLHGKNKRVYVAGPESMVEMLSHGLKEDGVAKENIMTDFYPGYLNY